MKVYVVGNLLVKQDSLPIRLLPRLKRELPNIDFVEFDPTEDFPKEKQLIIVDTVLDIKRVILLKDINKIQLNKVCSLHDFDMGYNLKLMKKFKLIDNVWIIGVPEKISEKKAVQQIKEVITNLSSKSV